LSHAFVEFVNLATGRTVRTPLLGAFAASSVALPPPPAGEQAGDREKRKREREIDLLS
jgi:hypothetical protein